MVQALPGTHALENHAERVGEAQTEKGRFPDQDLVEKERR